MNGKGKIARLPFDLRQKLNARMRDGEPDGAILLWLNNLPEAKAAIASAGYGGGKQARTTITPQNLSEYRGGAYKDWMADQARLDRIQAMAEFAMRMAEAAGGDINAQAVKIAGGKIFELLETAEGENLDKLAKIITGLNISDAAKVRTKIYQKRLELQSRTLALDEQKFHRQTAEMFLAWFADKRAQEIAEGKGAKEVKMDQLIQLMFGSAKNQEAG